MIRPALLPPLLLIALLVAPPPTAHAKLLKSLGNCIEANNYYINRVLPLVGPYGLTSSNAYTNTREPQTSDVDPGTPGGPAGLPLHRPFREPRLVEFSNVTNLAPDAEKVDSDGDESGVDFTPTNVQIKGVDEPDIIKTDGRRVYTLSGEIFSAVQIEEGGRKGRRVGALRLPSYPEEMLIEGDFVLVIGRKYDYHRPVFQRYKNNPSDGLEATVIYQLNVTLPQPRLISTLHLEGRYIRSRETDGTTRLVIRFNPLDSVWLYYPSGDISSAQTEKWNREIIQYSVAGNWLPTYHLRVGSRVQYGIYTDCKQTFRATDVFAGFKMTTVVTLNVDKLLIPKSSATVISDADTIYATKTSMYITTSEFRFNDEDSDRSGPNFETSIHRFNLTDQGATFLASGRITGSVINQFAMHENGGVFFIATTDGASWWTGRDLSASKVTAFETDLDQRELKKVGEVGNLGVGERIFAVRYRADVAYVVTFREIDPLYIVDLADPRNLRVTGELKIPGFSSYLHQVGKGLLLGVGREATLDGRTTGTKVSLFDVSDKSSPKELSSWTLEGSYSDAEWDHRAFLWYWRERLAVMPVTIYSRDESFSGAIVLHVSSTEITERGRVVHDFGGRKPSIKRNAVIGKDFLWSMSTALLQVNNVKNLTKVESQVKID